MTPSERVRTTWLPALGLVALWVALCAFVHHRGVGVFAPLDRTWQLVDVAWLRADPLGTLWRLHAQPPLYNATVAALLAGGIDPQGWVVHLGLDAMGAVGGLLTWRLALRLGAGPRTAWLAGALLMASPGYWLLAHWLFYDLPVTLLVTALIWLVPTAVQTSLRRWMAVAGVVVALGWLRSLFHPLWAVGLFALAAWCHPTDRRRIWAAASVAIGLMVLPYAKNLAQFGSPNASSWAGMSLLRTAHAHSSPQVRSALADQGRISRFGAIGPFRELTAYVAPPLPCRDPHPALCAVHKRSGAPNFNHVAYIDVSRQMAADAIAIYAAEPAAWARALLGSWLAWLRPVGVYPFLRPARQPIDDLHVAWTRFALVELDGAPVVLAFGVLVALAILAARLSRALRAGPHRPELAVLAVAAWTTLWVAAVGNTLEHGENYRFRAYLDPLLLALCASAMSQVAAGRLQNKP
ncbi:MAG: hypothetical protein FJ100_01805 [Deltaproteobacteria bacterium]|nr:hypothetical protein [Deltaproteobacteria bacterium]